VSEVKDTKANHPWPLQIRFIKGLSNLMDYCRARAVRISFNELIQHQTSKKEPIDLTTDTTEKATSLEVLALKELTTWVESAALNPLAH